MQDNHYTRYLTFSEDDKKWQLYCTDVGSNEIGPNVIYPPHKEQHPKQFKSVTTGRILSGYQMIYITAGEGVFISEGVEYAVNTGSVFFLFPNVKHAYKPKLETGWTEYWIGFQGRYADTLVQEGILSKEQPIFQVGIHNTLLSLFKAVFDEVNEQKPLYQFRTGAKIMMLLAQTLSYVKMDNQYSRSHEIVEKAKHIFDFHICGFIEIDSIAEEIGISKSHLCDVFKSYTDMTPYQYFIHIKINKAKELLDAGEPSIKEVAYQLGFEDQYYFSRLFKKKTGVPPSQWVIK